MYNFYSDKGACGSTYSLVLDLLGLSSLESQTVALVLKTLWCDKSLNLWCLGIWLLAITLWLNFSSNNVLSDLLYHDAERVD
jgi:hypothetical protein